MININEQQLKFELACAESIRVNGILIVPPWIYDKIKTPKAEEDNDKI